MNDRCRLKPLLNSPERLVLQSADEICAAVGARAFPKIRIADVVEITGSGLPDELYRYALQAHFDILIYKDNLAQLAIEFDGPGHDDRNDDKKAAICDFFDVPLLRIRNVHLQRKAFEDTALIFFIWQLFCVDHFLEEFGDNAYEPYHPIYFSSVEGKSGTWPFAYAARWRHRLRVPFQQAANSFDESVSCAYRYGLLQLEAADGTWVRGNEFRSICTQRITRDTVVWGMAELMVELYGMQGPRRDLFLEVTTFVEGLAAEKMYEHALGFLNESRVAEEFRNLHAKSKKWEEEGFHLKRGINWEEIRPSLSLG